MPIYPLPQFEADVEADRRDRETYERLKPPTSIVVRYGVMKLVGEFPYAGDAKPGCGSKVVVRTPRGVELGEMLTSTCPNSGCSKSVSRQEMLDYIENSGGRDYPFSTDGRAMRIATAQDLAEQSRIEGLKQTMIRVAREMVARLGLPMKIVEAEPILGGERLTYYFTSEERIDFRELIQDLSRHFSARIDLRQVGARDEARLVADYERCGQHCCCKQFLKVLKPISIKAAKTQKATLDPLKISGRCGRLMCCLRYEDETYSDLVKRLPKLRKSVGTPFGVGVVIDRQILTQLVLVRLDHDGRDVAVPVEDLMAPEDAPAPGAQAQAGVREDPLRGMPASQVEQRGPGAAAQTTRPGRSAEPGQRQQRHRDRVERESRSTPSEADRPPEESVEGAADASADSPSPDAPSGAPGERRRRRRRRRGGERRAAEPPGSDGSPGGETPAPRRGPPSQLGPVENPDAGTTGGGDGDGRKRRKRRRRRPGSGGAGPGGGSPFPAPGG